jgi:hypothetical protein
MQLSFLSKMSFIVFALLLNLKNSYAQVDWTKTIRVGNSVVYNLVGTADSKSVAAYLAPKGKTPKSMLKRTPIVLSVFVNSDVEGCGCPLEFNEFNMVYMLENKGSVGKVQISPDFQVTDKLQRQTSVAAKFGTEVQLGEVGFLDGDQGFYMKDSEGNVVIKAKPFGGMPYAYIPEFVDYGSHSLGGVLNGQTLKQTFSSLQGHIISGYRPFVPKVDTFQVNPNSKLAKHLKAINFIPLYWQTMDATSDMWVVLLKP